MDVQFSMLRKGFRHFNHLKRVERIDATLRI